MLATVPAPGARGPGLQGSDQQGPGYPRELMEGRGWPGEACAGERGAQQPRQRLRPGPWGGQWGCRARGPGVSLFPVLVLSMALGPGQQPTCLQGSPPWASSPQASLFAAPL